MHGVQLSVIIDVANRQHLSFPDITGVYMYHSDIRLETSESQQETEQAQLGSKSFRALATSNKMN